MIWMLAALGLANGLVLLVSAGYAYRRGIANLPLDAAALAIMAAAYALTISAASQSWNIQEQSSHMSGEEKTICFLVGAPRSGTTWIQRLLQSHPQICGGEESQFFNLFGSALDTAERMAEEPGQKFMMGPFCYVDKAELEDILRDVWHGIFRNLYAHHPDAGIHLEKTPNHAFHLDNIRRLFPDAKVIFLSRDSRAVTSSLVSAARGWGHYWAPRTYREAAIVWYRHVRAIRDWRRRNPDHPFLQVRYEDAVEDTPAELARLLRFLFPETDDLRIDETLQNFKAGEAARKDPKGFSRLRGTHGWQEDMTLRGKLTTWRYTRKLMRELGYEVSILH